MASGCRGLFVNRAGRAMLFQFGYLRRGWRDRSREHGRIEMKKVQAERQQQAEHQAAQACSTIGVSCRSFSHWSGTDISDGPVAIGGT